MSLIFDLIMRLMFLKRLVQLSGVGLIILRGAESNSVCILAASDIIFICIVFGSDANVNARDHGGRRPVDVLNPKCQQKTKGADRSHPQYRSSKSPF